MGVEIYSRYQLPIPPGNPQDTPIFCNFYAHQRDICQPGKQNAKKKRFDVVVNIGISESEFQYGRGRLFDISSSDSSRKPRGYPYLLQVSESTK